MKGCHHAQVFGQRAIFGIGQARQRQQQARRDAQLDFLGALLVHGQPSERKTAGPEGPAANAWLVAGAAASGCHAGGDWLHSGCLAFRPAASANLFGDVIGNGICRIRIQVRAQHVRRQAIPEKVGDGKDDVSRRNLKLHLVEPAPDMDLPDLRSRNAVTDAARQIDLAASHLDRCA